MSRTRICNLLPFLMGLVMMLFSDFQTFAQDGWKLEKDKNGIKVYTQKTNSSNLKDSRAVAIINADTREILELFVDVENHWKWMDRIKISRMVKKVSESEFFVYYEAVAPWPVSNRDLVTRYRVTMSDNGSIKIESIGEPNFIPKKDGLVRISEAISSWELIPREDNTVEVIFTNHSNPGGGVPDWLANMAATDNPYNTLKNLRDRLTLSK